MTSIFCHVARRAGRHRHREADPPGVAGAAEAANAFIESFNGRLRDECLNIHQFTSIEDAKAKIEAWRVDYNQRRPHSSLSHLTPSEYVARRQDHRVVRAATY
jgi:transposase InsO family protein